MDGGEWFRARFAGDARDALRTNMLTILEGSTFCLCDELGDIGAGTTGLFADDTRYLSRLELHLDGAPPLLLSSGKVEYFSAAFFLRNDVTAVLGQDTIAVDRRRFVGATGMTDTITVLNVGTDTVSFRLGLLLDADFADIFAVKERDMTLGRPDSHAPPRPPAAAELDHDGCQLVLSPEAGDERTQILFSRPCGWSGNGHAAFDLVLEPGESWPLRVDVVPTTVGEVAAPPTVEVQFGTEMEHVREALRTWRIQVPRVRAGWRNIEATIGRSISDLAALRIRASGTMGRLPAAGMPWFMTVFGRDTLITCLQTMLLGPELAKSALEVLASLQARVDDPTIDAEPGKILHELRRGRAAEAWFPVYYGTVDATPLYLVLLSETWRWTDDAELVHGLREPALRALEWIDSWGDLDGDGFVEYERRSERGLQNQSWKDSGDSQRFSDGRFADAPIAPAEVQGYVYDAKRRVAELARAVWNDEPLATRLESEAAALRARFDDAFWVDERGGYYALALDRGKARVDSLCSNIGHLLWSGIVPEARAGAIAERLRSPELSSVWGIRTMSTLDRAFNPLAYHRGTVWPHDTSIAAWGLARYGFWDDARALIRALFEAAEWFDWSLPEVFAGFRRFETPFPIAYPTAAKPQAWAAGAPVLGLQLLLGVRADPLGRLLYSDAPDGFPEWAGALELRGVAAQGGTWDVLATPGERVVVRPS